MRGGKGRLEKLLTGPAVFADAIRVSHDSMGRQGDFLFNLGCT